MPQFRTQVKLNESVFIDCLFSVSQVFGATNRVEAWGRVIQNQDGAYSDAAKIETCFVYHDFSTEDKEASQEQHENNMG